MRIEKDDNFKCNLSLKWSANVGKKCPQAKSKMYPYSGYGSRCSPKQYFIIFFLLYIIVYMYPSCYG